MNKIGFTSVTFRALSVDEIISLAKTSGVELIEWGADKHILPGDLETAAKTKEKCDVLGIKCISYGSYFTVGKSNISEFKAICKTASTLGAKTVRVWLGNKPSNQYSLSEIEKLVEIVKKLSETASQYNLNIAFEFHKNTLNDNSKSTIDFIQRVNSSNIKTYWQPFSKNHNEDIKNLKTVSKYLDTVHVFNWNEKEERFLLSEDIQKWQDFIKLIPSSCNLILEFVKNDNTDCFYKDMKVLKQLLFI